MFCHQQPQTDPDLLGRLIGAARNHKMTQAEVKTQKISFVYGQLNGKIPKERIEAILYGETA